LAALATSDDGDTAVYQGVLASQPLPGSTNPVASNNAGEGVAAPASLTFTAANWNVAQTVTVTGIDDAVQDGDIAYSVVLGAAASADPNYNALDPADGALSNIDIDSAGISVNP